VLSKRQKSGPELVADKAFKLILTASSTLALQPPSLETPTSLNHKSNARRLILSGEDQALKEI